MGLLKFIDNKLSFDRQRSYLISFLFFGVPIGGLTIWSKGWDKYNFSISSLIFSLIMDLMIASPLIINYIRQIKKYNLIVKKFHNKTLSFRVKAKMSFSLSLNSSEFVKDRMYEIQVFDETYIHKVWHHPNTWFHSDFDIVIICDNKWRSTTNFFDVINRFEIVDNLKEERKKKLERLQKIMK